MTRFVTIAIALLALATPALAGVPQHPGQHYSTFVSQRVCSQGEFKTAKTPLNKNLTVSVSVAGHQIPVITGNRSNTLDSAGYGVLVRIVQNSRRSAPLVVRVASVRSDCARVNVLATWR